MASRPLAEATKGFKTSLSKLLKLVRAIPITVAVLVVVIYGASQVVNMASTAKQPRQPTTASIEASRAQEEARAALREQQALLAVRTEKFAGTGVWYFQTSTGPQAQAVLRYDPKNQGIRVETPYTFEQGGVTKSGVTQINCRYTSQSSLDCRLVGKSGADRSRAIALTMYDRGGYLEGSYVDLSGQDSVVKHMVLASSEEVLRSAMTK